MFRSQQIEVPNQSVISNINIINTTPSYKGKAIHFIVKGMGLY